MSDATEFIIDGDTLSHHLSLWMVWERTLLSKVVERVKRGNSSLRQNFASVVDSHQPWLKDGGKWNSG